MRILLNAFCCIMLGLAITPATAQQDIDIKARQAMQRLASTYQKSPYLSFDVLYRYASEASPGQYLDSLRGQFKLHGSKYWSVLDDHETVFDSKLLLTVFKEDRILFLTKPAFSSMPGNPVILVDSFLVNKSVSSYEYKATAAEEVVTVNLPTGLPCKQINWYIDRKTGYLNRSESLMRADQLYDPSVQGLVTEAASVYVIVETVYRNYQDRAFDDKVFDMGHYFRKEGNDYVAVAPFEGYQVFRGSTGL